MHTPVNQISIHSGRSAQLADFRRLPLVLGGLVLVEYRVHIRLIQFHLRGYRGQLKPLLEPELEEPVDGLVAHPYLRLGYVSRPQSRAAAFRHNAPVYSKRLPQPPDLSLVEVGDGEDVDAAVAVFRKIAQEK